MSILRQLLEHPLFAALGWVLVHFLWQGAFIAGLLATLMLSMNRATSHVRYLAYCGLFLLMAVSPLITGYWVVNMSVAPVSATPPLKLVSLTQTQIETPPTAEKLQVEQLHTESIPGNVEQAVAPTAETTRPSLVPSLSTVVPFPERVRTAVEPWLSWLVLAWFLGVFVLSLRLFVSWRSCRARCG